MNKLSNLELTIKIDKPIAVCDPTGVYAPLRNALDHLASQNFMKTGQKEMVNWCSDIPSTIEAVKAK